MAAVRHWCHPIPVPVLLVIIHPPIALLVQLVLAALSTPAVLHAAPVLIALPPLLHARHVPMVITPMSPLRVAVLHVRLANTVTVLIELNVLTVPSIPPPYHRVQPSAPAVPPATTAQTAAVISVQAPTRVLTAAAVRVLYPLTFATVWLVMIVLTIAPHVQPVLRVPPMLAACCVLMVHIVPPLLVCAWHAKLASTATVSISQCAPRVLLTAPPTPLVHPCVAAVLSALTVPIVAPASVLLHHAPMAAAVLPLPTAIPVRA